MSWTKHKESALLRDQEQIHLQIFCPRSLHHHQSLYEEDLRDGASDDYGGVGDDDAGGHGVRACAVVRYMSNILTSLNVRSY